MNESVRNPAEASDPSLTIDPAVRRRLKVDVLARNMVSLGGVTIIFSILAILFVILAVAYPLFQSPEIELTNSFKLMENDSSIFAAGTDEYREKAFFIHPNGISLYSIKPYKALPPLKLSQLQGGRISSASYVRKGFYFLGLSDGRVLPVEVQLKADYSDNVRSVKARLAESKPFSVLASETPVTRLAAGIGEKGTWTAVVAGKSHIHLISSVEQKNLMGTVTRKKYTDEFDLPGKGEVSAMVFDSDVENLYIGMDTGQLLRIHLVDLNEEEIENIESLGWPLTEDVSLTSLVFLIGGQTLIAGNAKGKLASFQIFPKPGAGTHLRKIYSFKQHQGAVTSLGSSPRNKGFVSGGEDGLLRFHYGTTGKTQFQLSKKSQGKIQAGVLTPKANGILVVDSKGTAFNWSVENPHPEVTWDSLFGKIQYEGYKEEDYVWQSTGGTDEFEPKLSLIPLLIGTLKGTFYAILFAVPLALFAAFYTSQFMHEDFKKVVKPVIEIMAALPSVVLGFFAALWLAPNIEKILPGMVITPLVITLLVGAYLYAKEISPHIFGTGEKAGSEIYVLIGITLVGSAIGLYLGFGIEAIFLKGDYRTWLLEVLGLSYDQRNSLVVGLAMGFAVVPIIFTIAEDSLSNVPNHLKAGSLALGATPWQTAMQVILPTASPGIFSATMIGFGRAVGETMIVLMATGNTPVMDWSIFNGFRALSANIAVELPEAPEGGTLFRILFLAALLLFILTFVVNTLAEFVRLRLRERYRML